MNFLSEFPMHSAQESIICSANLKEDTLNEEIILGIEEQISQSGSILDSLQ